MKKAVSALLLIMMIFHSIQIYAVSDKYISEKRIVVEGECVTSDGNNITVDVSARPGDTYVFTVTDRYYVDSCFYEEGGILYGYCSDGKSTDGIIIAADYNAEGKVTGIFFTGKFSLNGSDPQAITAIVSPPDGICRKYMAWDNLNEIRPYMGVLVINSDGKYLLSSLLRGKE